MNLSSNKIVSVFLALSLFSLCILPQWTIAADDFETFRRQQQEGMQKEKAEFQEYKDKQDKEFADFLKGQWSEFDTFKGKVRIKEPKPKQIPVFVPVPTPEVPSPPPVVIAPVILPYKPAPLPAQPRPTPITADMLEIVFFGNSIRFNYDQQWRSYRLTAGSKPDAISAFWTMMSGSKYEPTIQTVKDASNDLKLDDWGGVTLWRSISQAIVPSNKPEQTLLLWFFLVKSGYDVRLGYAGSDIHLFVAMKQPVYATKFTKVGNQTYYAVLATDHGDNIRSFFTYEASYPGKLRPLDIQTASTVFTKTISAQRALAFDYKGKRIQFNIPYDRRLVDYFDTFPQSEFELYFDTSGSSLLRNGLLVELNKYTSNMKQDEAAEFLLTFVQQAFPYKTDVAQFGRERYFFVEESLYFPFNDCEDRSVLYAWLVKELIGVPVVGLLYPGHMTTALALKNPKSDAYTVSYQGKQYVVADPTYVGASIGMPMPSYARLKPTRIVEVK